MGYVMQAMGYVMQAMGYVIQAMGYVIQAMGYVILLLGSIVCTCQNKHIHLIIIILSVRYQTAHNPPPIPLRVTHCSNTCSMLIAVNGCLGAIIVETRPR